MLNAPRLRLGRLGLRNHRGVASRSGFRERVFAIPAHQFGDVVAKRLPAWQRSCRNAAGSGGLAISAQFRR